MNVDYCQVGVLFGLHIQLLKQLNLLITLVRLHLVSLFEKQADDFYSLPFFFHIPIEGNHQNNFANTSLIAYFNLADGREDNYVYVSEALLAGMAAGGVEAVICTPFELLKLRKQVASASGYRTISTINVMQDSTPVISKLLPGYTPDVRAWNSTVGILSNLSPKHMDIVGALKHYPWMLTGSGRPPLASEVKRPQDVISLEGWNSLWRGLRSGIARDCIFGGIFFSTWQFLHIAMLNWKAIDINPPPRFVFSTWFLMMLHVMSIVFVLLYHVI